MTPFARSLQSDRASNPFYFSSRRRHTRFDCDWSSDVCSSDLWDYAYLEVSDDGGATWSIVETPSGTSEDPSGNSYGWGYNAFSGGGSSGEWIEERVDLSPYAGKEILVRLEYGTG